MSLAQAAAAGRADEEVPVSRILNQRFPILAFRIAPHPRPIVRRRIDENDSGLLRNL